MAMNLERDLKGAEALTFAAALIGISTITLRYFLRVPVDEPVTAWIFGFQYSIVLIVLVYAASRCIHIGVFQLFPTELRGNAEPLDKFLFFIFAAILVVFSAFLPEEDTAEDADQCSTVGCYLKQLLPEGRQVDSKAAPQ